MSAQSYRMGKRFYNPRNKVQLSQVPDSNFD